MENFDSGAPGWQGTGLWQVKQRPETVRVSPSIGGLLTDVPAGSPLPAAWSGTGVAWFGDAETGTYCAGWSTVDQHPSDGCRSAGVVAGSLVSPPLALTAPARLRFHAWWEIAAGDFETSDLMTVDYSTDGGTSWTEAARLNPRVPPVGSLIQSYSSGGLRLPGTWREYDVDLTAAAGMPDVRVRFRFDSVDSQGQGFRGLLVDDVVVEGSDVAGGAAPPGEAPGPSASAAAPAPAAAPVLGQTVLLELVSGHVSYRPPGARRASQLVQPALVPIGTVVDTRAGRVRIVTAGADGASQSGTFRDGRFQIRQGTSDPLVELALRGGGFPHCGGACTSAKHRVRRLWGNATGRFRTRGRYASCAVRGTEWLVEDHPGDTLVTLRRGSGLVRDFVRDRDVIVNEGESYVARVVYTNRQRGNPRFGHEYILVVRDGRVVHVYPRRGVVVGR
jgi:hypothetical protein